MKWTDIGNKKTVPLPPTKFINKRPPETAQKLNAKEYSEKQPTQLIESYKGRSENRKPTAIEQPKPLQGTEQIVESKSKDDRSWSAEDQDTIHQATIKIYQSFVPENFQGMAVNLLGGCLIKLCKESVELSKQVLLDHKTAEGCMKFIVQKAKKKASKNKQMGCTFFAMDGNCATELAVEYFKSDKEDASPTLHHTRSKPKTEVKTVKQSPADEQLQLSM